MKIECILRRKDGTRVDISGKEYHFKPTDTDERHIAEVAVQAHASRFLSIKEAYRAADEEGEALAASADTPAESATGQSLEDDPEDDPEGDDDELTDEDPPAPVALKGADFEPATATLPDGTVVNISDVVQSLFEKTGWDIVDWNEQKDEMIGVQIEAEIERLATEHPAAEPVKEAAAPATPVEGASEAQAPKEAEAKAPAADTRTPAQKRADTIAAKKAAKATGN